MDFESKMAYSILKKNACVAQHCETEQYACNASHCAVITDMWTDQIKRL